MKKTLLSLIIFAPTAFAVTGCSPQLSEPFFSLTEITLISSSANDSFVSFQAKDLLRENGKKMQSADYNLNKFGLILDYVIPEFDDLKIHAVLPFSINGNFKYLPEPETSSDWYTFAFDEDDCSITEEDGIFSFTYNNFNFFTEYGSKWNFFKLFTGEIGYLPRTTQFNCVASLVFWDVDLLRDLTPNNCEIMKNTHGEPISINWNIYLASQPPSADVNRVYKI